MISTFAAAVVAAAVAAMGTPTPESAASAPAPEAAPAVDPAEAEYAAAKANVALIKSKPRWLSGPKLELPESERALGHHGVVTVAGVLGEDGRLRRARVRQSSGAPALDALALSFLEASVFEPARDGEGRAMAVPMNVPQEFYAYKSNEPGGGLVRYGCRQFVLDMDWWRSAHPDAEWSRHELYTMILGVRTVARLNSLAAMKGAEFKAELADFERRWGEAIETCRTKPERRLADVLKPEGAMIDALSRAR